MLARGDRLRGRGRLHSVSSFPGPRYVWEESRAFWQSSLLVSDLLGPALYHRATVRLSVTRHRHQPISSKKGFFGGDLHIFS